MGTAEPLLTWTRLALNPPAANAPGVFPRELVDADETIVFEARPSLWGMYGGRLLVFGFWEALLLTAMAGDGQMVSEPGIAAFLLGLFALPLIWWWMAWRRTRYALTDRRVLSISGVISRDFRAASYDEVQNLRLAGSAIIFDGSPTGSRAWSRRSGAVRRIEWRALPYPQQVYDFAQGAFGIRTREARAETLRQQLSARVMEGKVVCAYCGGILDVRSIDPAAPNCPRCGAPVVAP